ncbi:MAG: hypothetical protein DRJ13_16825 [Bacteroidetes bacterium]|nr:MAG: hypothetical protein DRJ13_16825 [Bacteroidota bacterium]
MKTYFLIFLLALLPASAFSQIVKGRIIDIQTRKPVPFAAVYFNGTFVGTTSDQTGNFQINVTSFVSMPLTISAIGYYSYTLTDFSIGGPVVILLAPKIYEIGEVEISGNTAARRRKVNLKAFRNEFLGKTPNARKCEILNEEVISFFYDSNKDTIRAYAMEPIQIQNTALAYEVTYYLDKFEFNKRSTSLFFSGNILFSEDDSTYRRFTMNKRKRTFLGSRMHFFRALWADELYSTKFTVKSPSGDKLSYEDMVILSPMNTKFMKYPESLVIHYAVKWSKINFKSEFAYFASDGYFDPAEIGWEGEMGKKRIGDSLPYEYNVSY